VTARSTEDLHPHRADIPERPEAEQREYVSHALTRARDAIACTGAVEHRIILAGSRIALIFAGPTLAEQFMPALAHIADRVVGPPDLTLLVWDSMSSGVAGMPPPCARECFTDRGEFWGMMHPRVRSAFQWGEFSLSLLDLDRRAGSFWVEGGQALPDWSRAAPFRTLLHWWIEELGGQLLHAAAVGTSDGALLITGKGGIGKSTTALACLTGGMQFVGDDYVMVTADPLPTVHALYGTAKITPGQVARFPGLADLVTNAGAPVDEKAVLQLVPRFADQLPASLPIVAIATPSFGDAPGTRVGAESASALRRAAEFTTISQLPHAGRYAHDFIGRLVAALPRLHLELGHDLQSIAPAIREIVGTDREQLRRHAAEPSTANRAASQPLISVVIPVYNGAAFLPHATASVMAQGYPAIEIVIVDDGSTDDLSAAVAALPWPVRVVRQENAGAAAARNRGIRAATGDFFAFLDVDDILPASTLERLMEEMTVHPNADVVMGRVQLSRFTTFEDPGEFIGSPTETFRFSLGAGLFRRRAFERIGLLDEELRYGEDSDWFNRAHEYGLHVADLDEVTLVARRHGANMTHRKSMVELNTLRVFKKAVDRHRSHGASASTAPRL
jgi:hypothetical protein